MAIERGNAVPLACFPFTWWLMLYKRHGLVLDTEENYQKQSFRNRFCLPGVNGVITLTIPVESQDGKPTPIKEIRIAGESWRRSYVQTIRSVYGRSAYFEHYMEGLEKVFMAKENFLLDFNLKAFEWLTAHLVLEVTNPSGPDSGLPLDILEPSYQWPALPPYPQVFIDRNGFVPNMSCIDLLMNLGPRASDYISRCETL